MKKLSLLFAIIFFSTLGYTQIKLMQQTESKELDKVFFVKNNAESSIRILQFDTEEIEWQQDTAIYSDLLFNKVDNTFTEIIYFPQYSKTVIKLSPEYKILERDIYDEKNNITGRNIYYYENDMLKKREIYLGQMKSFDEIYEYTNDRLSTLKYVLPDGTVLNYSTFEYDKWNNLYIENKYTSSGEIENIYEYKSDMEGKLLEEKIIINDSFYTKINYTYDGKGHLIYSTVKDNKENIISSNSYEYNDYGKIEREISENGTLKTEIKYIYDTGILVEKYFFDHTDNNSYILKFIYN